MKACSSSNNEQADSKAKPFIWLGIVYGILTSLFVIFILKNRKRREIISPTLENSHIAVDPTIRPVASISEVFATQDDLTKILGIGPVISNFFKSKGIYSYRQLSELTSGDIKNLLAEKKFRLQNPQTWSEQAALAAIGDWEGLARIQKEM